MYNLNLAEERKVAYGDIINLLEFLFVNDCDDGENFQGVTLSNTIRKSLPQDSSNTEYLTKIFTELYAAPNLDVILQEFHRALHEHPKTKCLSYLDLLYASVESQILNTCLTEKRMPIEIHQNNT